MSSGWNGEVVELLECGCIGGGLAAGRWRTRGPVAVCRRIKKPAGSMSGGRGFVERTTGFEPATPTLARSCSTS